VDYALYRWTTVHNTDDDDDDDDDIAPRYHTIRRQNGAKDQRYRTITNADTNSDRASCSSRNRRRGTSTIMSFFSLHRNP